MLINNSAALSQVSGQDVDTGKQMTLAKSQPIQLALFQTFLPQEDDRYSNTIELYDAVPKYFASKTLMAAQREGSDGKYLPTLEREFRYRDRVTGEDAIYAVEITPARVKDKHGKEREYYPSGQEELVEEALRKIACDGLNGVFLDGTAGVQFTMYELRQELKARGHSMHLDSLIRCLTICRRASIIIRKKGERGAVLMDSSIFPTVMIAHRSQWEENPKHTYCYAQFNPLVTHSINKLTYRQFDYDLLMQYRYQLSRWFHKRLFHNFTNADLLHKYNLLLSTIIRDSALVNAKRMNDKVRAVEASLEELREKGIIFGYEREERRGPRNRLDDILYHLSPSISFVDEIKKANKRRGKQSEELHLLRRRD
jgi:hypothetical protein